MRFSLCNNYSCLEIVAITLFTTLDAQRQLDEMQKSGEYRLKLPYTAPAHLPVTPIKIFN